MARIVEGEEELYCSDCGAEVSNEECAVCGGDGFVWHDGDAEEPWEGYEGCEECDGKGRFISCPTHGDLDW